MSDDANALNPETQAQPNPEPGAQCPAPGARNAPCRAITTAGQRCKNDALDNSHLCYSHARHRHPTLPHPTQVSIPLLEDHASVQLVTTQVIHGLLTLKMEPDRARTILYALSIVASTLPRFARLPAPNPPSAPNPEPGARHPEPDHTQVHTLTLDEYGPISADGDQPAPNAHWSRPAPGVDPLAVLDAAPNTPRPDPLPATEPLTHCECPTCRQLFLHGIDPTLHPHLQPIQNPHCSFNHPHCQGPESDTRCPACETMRKLMPHRRRKQQPKPSTPDTQPHDTQDDHWEPFDYQASAAEPSILSAPDPAPTSGARCPDPGARLATGCPERVIPQPWYPATPAESNTGQMASPPGGTPQAANRELNADK
jgi:hypothetical protein